MSKNNNLHAAKKAKNDEFYTLLPDIEHELMHYKEFFKDKVVYCNCDDDRKSNFWKYFELNFDHLQLKKLIATHYDQHESTYKIEMIRGNDINGDGKMTSADIVQTALKGNGDFHSFECIELLKEADIVVTNPPFSDQLPTELIKLCLEYEKQFILISPYNTITYKEFFPLIRDNKVWLGYTSPKTFCMPDGNMKKFGNIIWFTNIDIKKRHEELILFRTYNEIDYPKYDNYNAINVNKVSDIPMDYDGIMGVPITFLDKYCPDQFDIIGEMVSTTVDQYNFGYPYVNGKKIYARILIRKKQ